MPGAMPPPEHLASLNAAPPASWRPSHARYWVIVFAVALAIIQYIDRVCISQAAPLISRDLSLNKWQMGWVFSGFTLAYALFEIPAGYLGDRIGPRKVLLRIVLWWSFFTVATGWMWNWASLLVTRFLFGAGRGGGVSEPDQAFHRWLPLHERTRAQGVMWMSARLGGAFTPGLVFLCLRYVTWRTAFLLFGVLGVVWAVLFFWWYRDDPRASQHVNSAEAALLPVEADPGHQFRAAVEAAVHLAHRLVLVRPVFCVQLQLYFFITWFPTYLLEARHFEIGQGSLMAACRCCWRVRFPLCRLGLPDLEPALG